MKKRFFALATILSVTISLAGCSGGNSEVKDNIDYNEKNEAVVKDENNANQQADNSVTENNAENKIPQADAEAAALKHAGFSADEVTNLHTEYDYDDGRYEYDVEFYADGYEYSYEIDAVSGKITKSEKDID